MAEVDTSIYRNVSQPDLLGTAKKFGDIAQQSVAIDQAKLNLINQRYQILNKELGILASDPNLTQDKFLALGQNMVKQGFLPADMWAKHVTMMPAPTGDAKRDQAALRGFAQQSLMRSVNAQEAINFQFGTPQIVNQGSQLMPGVSGALGQPFQPTGQAIPLGLSPENVTGQDTRVQPDGTSINVPRVKTFQDQGIGIAPGNVPVIPRGAATPAQRPAARSPAATLQGQGGPAATPAAPAAPNPLQGAPSAAAAPSGGMGGVVVARPPGDARLDEAQSEEIANREKASTTYQQDIQPLHSAAEILNRMKPGDTGVTREAINRMKNAMIALGIPVPDKVGDGVADFEKLNKYFEQSVGAKNIQSDARLQSAQAANAGVDKTVATNMAIITQQIAQRRLDEAAIRAFREAKNRGETTNQKAAEWISRFKNKQDVVAYAFDTMSGPAQKKLLNEMPPDKEKKFLESVGEARRLKVIEK